MTFSTYITKIGQIFIYRKYYQYYLTHYNAMIDLNANTHQYEHAHQSTNGLLYMQSTKPLFSQQILKHNSRVIKDSLLSDYLDS